MVSSNKNKLHAVLGNPHNPYPNGIFGVEVELEGNLYGPSTSTYWTVKPENSLRGGLEYVLRVPTGHETLPKALREFDSFMNNSKPHKSIRCSTHIHVSVLDYTIEQIYNAMMGWYFLEDLLVQTQSKNRQGNLFCLRLSDAEEIAVSINDSLENRDGIYTFHPERNRYAALNLCAITKFGSFEFRFLDAMTSGQDIERWCKIFYNIMENTKNVRPDALLKMYDEMSAVTFLSALMGAQYVPFVCGNLSPHQITKYLHKNYDHLFEFAQILSKKKFQLPMNMWNEDIDHTIRESSPLYPTMGMEPDSWLAEVIQSQSPATTLTTTAAGHSPFVYVDEFSAGDFTDED